MDTKNSVSGVNLIKMAKESNKPVEEPEKVEAVDTLVEAKPIEEPKVNRFKNNSEKGIKIKLVDGKNFKWITVKPGDIVTIPKKIAKANGLVKVQ